MTNDEILRAFLEGDKTLIEFYSYPTGGGAGDEILAIDSKDKDLPSLTYRNLIQFIINLGASCAGYSHRADNKVAVRMKVSGLDFDLYCYTYDGKCYLTTGVRPHDNQSPKEIYWILQF